MTYPAYVREKAIELRVVKRLSVDEIAERLAVSKATAYGWVGDIPLQRPRRENARVAGEVTRAKHAALRQAAYDRGMQSWPILSADPTFRDFVALAVRAFWGAVLDLEPASIKLQRKSNSGQLSGRSWRSEHGVLTLWAYETYLRARMQAWMDCIKASWV